MNRAEAHKILGTNSSMSIEDIKKEYRRAAQKYHPDRNKAADAEAKFKEVKEAFELLETSAETNQRSGRPNPEPNPFDNVDLGDFAEMLRRWGKSHAYGTGKQGDRPKVDPIDDYESNWGASGPGAYRAPNSNQKQVMSTTIQITIEEAFKGCTRTINIPDTNKISGTTPTTINIAAGLSDASVVHKVEVGNITYQVVIRIMSEYKIDYANPFANAVGAGNIMREYRLNPLMMIIGGFISVKTIDGGTVAVRVPEGLEGGVILKLKGKGYWAGTKCQHRGDCFLRIVPSIQKLDETDPEMLKTFKALLDAHLEGLKKKNDQTAAT